MNTKEEKRSSALGKSSSFVDKYLTEKTSNSTTKKSSDLSAELERSKKTFESTSSKKTFKRDVITAKDLSTEQTFNTGSIKSEDSSKLSSTESVRRKVFDSEKKSNYDSLERFDDFSANFLTTNSERNVKERPNQSNQSTNISSESVRRKELLSEKLPIRQTAIDQSVRLKDSWKPLDTTIKTSIDSTYNRTSSTTSFVDQSLKFSRSGVGHPPRSESFNPLRHSKSVGVWSNGATSCRLEEG